MPRLKPLVEREACWALGLATLGAVSLWATLPAALWLVVRTFRRRTGGDGTEPAIAVVAIGMAWISFLLGYPALISIAQTAGHAPDHARAWAFFGGLLVLALTAGWLVDRMVRIHPERWVARTAAAAGLVVVVTAGALQAFVLITGFGSCGKAFARNADCVGTTPWIVVAPALAVGGAWFVISVLLKEIHRTQRLEAEQAGGTDDLLDQVRR
jgi:hypothetical protein